MRRRTPCSIHRNGSKMSDRWPPERECLKYDSSGPDGFSDSGDGTWTMASRAKQEFSSFHVIAIDNHGIAEQHGHVNRRLTQRWIGNMSRQAFVTLPIEEDFQFHLRSSLSGIQQARASRYLAQHLLRKGPRARACRLAGSNL